MQYLNDTKYKTFLKVYNVLLLFTKQTFNQIPLIGTLVCFIDFQEHSWLCQVTFYLEQFKSAILKDFTELHAEEYKELGKNSLF